jgi:hypothetical protein
VCFVFCRAYAHVGDYAKAREQTVQIRESSERTARWLLGDLALDQGDHQRARADYEAALRLSSAESTARCRALCGLTRIALVEGDLAQAQSYAAEILHGLGASWWTGYTLDLAPYLVCYQSLHANGDSRAWDVLDEAYRLLQASAAAIDDEALRRSYLENVAANREIVAAWKASHP